MAVIVACTVLHNICIIANDPLHFEENSHEGGHFDQLHEHRPNARSNAIRQTIIDQYFLNAVCDKTYFSHVLSRSQRC